MPNLSAPSPSPVPPPAPAAPSVSTAPATSVPAAPAPTPTPVPAQAAPSPANIATAHSGAVPSGTTVSPPLGGPLQVAVIQFGRNSSRLGTNDASVVRRVADIYKRNGGTVRVLGHAAKDVVGATAAEIKNGNLSVSISRAEAVANLLIRYGVPSDAIIMEGVSDEEPVYETRTARGLAANRRAEIFVDF